MGIEEFLEEGFSIIPIVIIAVIGIFMSIVSTAAKAKKAQESQATYVAQKKATPKPIQPTKLPPVTSLADYVPGTHIKSSLTFSDKHSHAGDSFEVVEEYTGSLGGESTEGCAEHRGVRFLTKVPTEQDEESDYDYEQLAMAMVLGTAFSEPRYKDY